MTNGSHQRHPAPGGAEGPGHSGHAHPQHQGAQEEHTDTEQSQQILSCHEIREQPPELW